MIDCMFWDESEQHLIFREALECFLHSGEYLAKDGRREGHQGDRHDEEQ